MLTRISGEQRSLDIRRIDFDQADLFIKAEGDWRGFRSGACAKEPETTEWIKCVVSHGTVFFDIGACVGSYSLIADSLGAIVHAFEPVAVNYAQLQANSWLNNSERISAWPVACTDTTRPLTISLSSPVPGAASHTVAVPGRVAPIEKQITQQAIGFGLDKFIEEFQLPVPTDIKLDVDGGEIAVLEGARKALRDVRSVMVEVSPDSAPSAAAILLAAGLEQTGSWPRSGNQSNHLFERIS